MAEFYGGVKGGRGEATRLGHKTSGLRTFAKSWQSRVSVEYQSRGDGIRVSILAKDEASGRSMVLFDGTEAELLARIAGPVKAPSAPIGTRVLQV